MHMVYKINNEYNTVKVVAITTMATGEVYVILDNGIKINIEVFRELYGPSPVPKAPNTIDS